MSLQEIFGISHVPPEVGIVHLALGEKPKEEQLMEWLADAWQLRRAREEGAEQAAAG